MTTITPTADIPLPPGADSNPDCLDDWQPTEDGRRNYRLIWSPSYEPCLDIRVVVVQFDDGSIADGDDNPDDAPLVYVGGSDFLPEDARAIAQSIIRAADLADEWAGVKR
ncbi:hypothetical protein [Arthrobacter sp. SLBN-53]|uniref:hypothetical protein n=1 Tax=Arthrobacter sp. SLBN-53 TaxID=2768412 RepID=UPI00115480AF|nr:hypothetical protein [Arthrobacter sp. SLBN-53]TQK27894.1 hypothetical protein FBY28_0856 [Arthrobacter sp. SLBN-53]